MDVRRTLEKRQPWYPAESRRRRNRLLWSLLLLLLTAELGSACATAGAVKRALLCTDTYYIDCCDGKYGHANDEAYLQGKPYRYPDKGFPYRVVFVEEDEGVSIESSFNNMAYIYSPAYTIRAATLPIITLYGLGEKRVWILYSVQVYDGAGEHGAGEWYIPAKITYRWTGLRWEVTDVWKQFEANDLSFFANAFFWCAGELFLPPLD